MRKIALLIPLIGVLSACGGGGSGAPITPLKVSSAYPYLFQNKYLQVDTTIPVYFSAPVDKASAASGVKLLDASGVQVPATVDASGSGATLKLTQALKPDSRYTLVVSSGVKGTDGGTLAQEWRQEYTTEPIPYPIKLVGYTVSVGGTAWMRATFTYQGTVEAGAMWIRAACKEDGYPNLTTYMSTIATASKWAPGQTNNIALEHSSGFSYFTSTNVSCKFSSQDSENKHRIIFK